MPLLSALALVVLASAVAAEPHLVKVIGLGRHGNRESNSEVDALCPRAAEHIPWIAKRTWEAALTTTGEVQCMLAGHFLADRYHGLGLLERHVGDDHTTFFYADASDRNIACLDIAKRSMFKGARAGDWHLEADSEHNQVLPVVTTKLGHDRIMRLPKHHLCKAKVKADELSYGSVDEPLYKQEHAKFLQHLGDTCGFDFDQLVCGDEEKGAFGGKCLSWGLKNMNDAIGFAKYEGLDWTLGGHISDADLAELKEMASHLTHSQALRLDTQVTYTVGEFPKTALFDNMRKPGADETKLNKPLQGVDIDSAEHPWDPTPQEFYYHNKFLLFWNHRELITGLLYLFGGVDASGKPVDIFPSTGAMVLWEVWEDEEGQFIRYYTWELNPDRGSFSDLSARWPHLKSGVLEHVQDYSSFTEIFPDFCKTKGRCTLEEFEAAFDAWTAKTGTWQQICGAEGQAEDLASAQDELGRLRAELSALRASSTAELSGARRPELSYVAAAVAAAATVSAAAVALRSRRDRAAVEAGYLDMSA